MMILLPVILPVLVGFVLLFIPEKALGSRQKLLKITGLSLLGSAALAVLAISGIFGERLVLFCLIDAIPVYFAIDAVGKIFAGIVIFVFLMAGFFSFSYMVHEKNEKRYYSFYLITFGVLMGLCFAGNLVTLYLFYEFMTLASMPLVLHSGTKEAIMAGLKYMFYSFCGAYMALFGIYVLYHNTRAAAASGLAQGSAAHMMDFVAGGSLDMEAAVQSGNTGLCLIAVFLMIVGFGDVFRFMHGFRRHIQ